MGSDARTLHKMGALRRMAQKGRPKNPQVENETGRSFAGQTLQPPSEQSQQQAHSGSFVPTAAQVMEAIETLYEDELKPFGRILRKRIAERFVGGGNGDEANLPDVDIKHLRNVCETSKQLHISLEEGGDWSAVIINREPRFVNVYSPHDPYPQELWDKASSYFESAGETLSLPGGRYSCAQALVSRGLDFLKGLSLGQVCHIVQLAISQKRILGYFSGAVVPYSRSQSMVKEWCAYKGAPCMNPAVAGGNHTAQLPLATWDQVRHNMEAILHSASTPGNPGSMPLSNVKRLFRSRFHLELSETMLGYSKLSELLQDPRLSNLCSVQLQGHGYIVVKNEKASSDNTMWNGGNTGVLSPVGRQHGCGSRGGCAGGAAHIGAGLSPGRSRGGNTAGGCGYGGGCVGIPTGGCCGGCAGCGGCCGHSPCAGQSHLQMQGRQQAVMISNMQSRRYQGTAPGVSPMSSASSATASPHSPLSGYACSGGSAVGCGGGCGGGCAFGGLPGSTIGGCGGLCGGCCGYMGGACGSCGGCGGPPAAGGMYERDAEAEETERLLSLCKPPSTHSSPGQLYQGARSPIPGNYDSDVIWNEPVGGNQSSFLPNTWQPNIQTAALDVPPPSRQPWRVEIRSDSPLRGLSPSGPARRRVGAYDHEESEGEGREVSPGKNRVYWPATPDSSPDPMQRFHARSSASSSFVPGGLGRCSGLMGLESAEGRGRPSLRMHNPVPPAAPFQQAERGGGCCGACGGCGGCSGEGGGCGGCAPYSSPAVGSELYGALSRLSGREEVGAAAVQEGMQMSYIQGAGGRYHYSSSPRRNTRTDSWAHGNSLSPSRSLYGGSEVSSHDEPMKVPIFVSPDPGADDEGPRRGRDPRDDPNRGALGPLIARSPDRFGHAPVSLREEDEEDADAEAIGATMRTAARQTQHEPEALAETEEELLQLRSRSMPPYSL